MKRLVVLAAVSVIGPAIISGSASCAEGEENADDGRGILRFDLMSARFVPISAEDMKAGHIYSHFSKRLNRRVWSYVRENGKFWHAFGEGTTQEAWRLDIRATMKQRQEKLAQVDPEFFEEIRRTGGDVFVGLGSDNDWVLDRNSSHPTIFNAETGHRWEWVSGRYIPVSSGPGRYQWVIEAGKYVPLERLPGRTHCPGCNLFLSVGTCRCRLCGF